MKTIHDFLDIHEDDLPCYCLVSNASKGYTQMFGDTLLVEKIIVEPLFKDTYPHTQSYEQGLQEAKDTYVRRALAENGNTYDFAIAI